VNKPSLNLGFNKNFKRTDRSHKQQKGSGKQVNNADFESQIDEEEAYFDGDLENDDQDTEYLVRIYVDQ